MTGDVHKFSNLSLKAKGYVTYGDNNKGRILGSVKVGASLFTSIEDVLYVEGLKHNLLCISQLCDKGFNINFTKDECLIQDEDVNEMDVFGNQRTRSIKENSEFLINKTYELSILIALNIKVHI